MAVFHRTLFNPYPESDQIRDLAYLDRIQAPQRADPVVVERLVAYGLILGVEYGMNNEGMVLYAPRGEDLMLKMHGRSRPRP